MRPYEWWLRDNKAKTLAGETMVIGRTGDANYAFHMEMCWMSMYAL